MAIHYMLNVKNIINNYSIQLQQIEVYNNISYGKTGKQRAKVRKTFDLNCGRLRSEMTFRAVARALIWGGGGCLFIYSCYARRISFEISCF